MEAWCIVKAILKGIALSGEGVHRRRRRKLVTTSTLPVS